MVRKRGRLRTLVSGHCVVVKAESGHELNEGWEGSHGEGEE